MLIKEHVNGVKHYLSVESNYKDPSEVEAAQDTVLFETGRISKGKEEIDSVVIVSTDDARTFAMSILQTCDEIESKEESGIEVPGREEETIVEIAQGVELLNAQIIESVQSVCLLLNDALEIELRRIHNGREVLIDKQCIELIKVAAKYTEIYTTLSNNSR